MRLRFLAGYVLGLLFAWGTSYLVTTIYMNVIADKEESTQTTDLYGGMEFFELNDWSFLRHHINRGSYELYDMQKKKVGTFRRLPNEEWEIVNQEGTTWHHVEIVDEETKSIVLQTLSETKSDWIDFSISYQNLTQDDLVFLEKCRFNAINLSNSYVPDTFWTLNGVSCVERISLWGINVTPVMMREFSKFPNLKTVELRRCTFCFSMEN